jgi:hypothetical protein
MSSVGRLVQLVDYAIPEFPSCLDGFYTDLIGARHLRSVSIAQRIQESYGQRPMLVVVEGDVPF